MVIAPAATILDEAFDAFWAAYPRKVGKQAARKAFGKAVAALAKDNLGRPVTAPLDIIVAGAHRLAADPNLPEMSFVPHPSTWLSRGGWEDAPYPVRATATGGRPTTADRVAAGRAVAERMAEAEANLPAAWQPVGYMDESGVRAIGGGS